MRKKIHRYAKYFFSELSEIEIWDVSAWGQKFFLAFPALKHRNYRLYFTGQLVSLIGTWIQTVAQGWLVWQLSHSALWVGIVVALDNFPLMLFGLYGGVLTDRFPKKNILLFTQFCSGVLAIVLGVLTLVHRANVINIAFIALLVGIINALDKPARLAFANEMVGKEDLSSAIALNSMVFNLARIVGPAIAGITIAVIGTGGAFLVNGISYMAVLIALLLMKVREIQNKIPKNALHAIGEGIQYAFSHSLIRKLLLFAAVNSIFGWTYSTLMPVIVEKIFHQGANVLGFAYAASGIGAILGSVLVSVFAKRIKPLSFVTAGNVIFAVSLFIFSFVSSFMLALPFLFLMGFSLLIQFSTINAMIQKEVSDALRGRVMGLYALMFMGMSPIGSIQMGFVAEQ